MYTDRQLISAALNAAKNSYSPYSGCTVGAALLTASGKLFTGCNIENAAFSPTCCAERTAIFKAVSEGERNFLKIAVAGGKNGIFSLKFTPCGTCRQVLGEFCGENFEIITAESESCFKKYRLGELLPEIFSSDEVV